MASSAKRDMLTESLLSVIDKFYKRRNWSMIPVRSVFNGVEMSLSPLATYEVSFTWVELGLLKRVDISIPPSRWSAKCVISEAIRGFPEKRVALSAQEFLEFSRRFSLCQKLDSMLKKSFPLSETLEAMQKEDFISTFLKMEGDSKSFISPKSSEISIPVQ